MGEASELLTELRRIADALERLAPPKREREPRRKASPADLDRARAEAVRPAIELRPVPDGCLTLYVGRASSLRGRLSWTHEHLAELRLAWNRTHDVYGCDAPIPMLEMWIGENDREIERGLVHVEGELPVWNTQHIEPLPGVTAEEHRVLAGRDVWDWGARPHAPGGYRIALDLCGHDPAEVLDAMKPDLRALVLPDG